jgi:hypothetical protein
MAAPFDDVGLFFLFHSVSPERSFRALSESASCLFAVLHTRLLST